MRAPRSERGHWQGVTWQVRGSAYFRRGAEVRSGSRAQRGAGRDPPAQVRGSGPEPSRGRAGAFVTFQSGDLQTPFTLKELESWNDTSYVNAVRIL